MVQWLRLCSSNTGAPDSIPAQETRPACHSEDQKPCMPQLRLGATKQINKSFKKKSPYKLWDQREKKDPCQAG